MKVKIHTKLQQQNARFMH